MWSRMGAGSRSSASHTSRTGRRRAISNSATAWRPSTCSPPRPRSGGLRAPPGGRGA
jgi:hypothetical protein